MEYTTIQKTADRWGISKARVHKLCQEGRIPGAVFENKHWRVPVDAIKPDGLGPTGTLSASKKAKEWGVSLEIVIRLCELGHIPDAVHIGRFWYIPGDAVYPLEGYLPLPMQAEKWGIPRQFMWKLCTGGRVPGAKRIGRDWYVPTDAKRPANELMGRKPGYTSPTKIAEKWGVSRTFVCTAAKEGRIPGAELIDGKWHIPENAEKPTRQYRRRK